MRDWMIQRGEVDFCNLPPCPACGHELEITGIRTAFQAVVLTCSACRCRMLAPALMDLKACELYVAYTDTEECENRIWEGGAWEPLIRNADGVNTKGSVKPSLLATCPKCGKFLSVKRTKPNPREEKVHLVCPGCHWYRESVEGVGKEQDDGKDCDN